MPKPDPHPARRPAVVTGASSGIGRATALRLAAAGHPVAIGARRVDRLAQLVDEIRGAGGEAIAVPLDLADGNSVRAFAGAVTDAIGPIEVLVSNAGVVDPITTYSSSGDFAAQLQVNLLGAQALVEALLPAMIDRRRGDVVFVTSDVAVNPRPLMGGYVAAKWALEGLAQAMAMELEGTGVRVGVVRPGPSSTEQGTTWDVEQVLEVMASWEHFGLLRHSGALRPDELADAVLAMISVPRGTRWAVLEVQPEAPVEARRTDEPVTATSNTTAEEAPS